MICSTSVLTDVSSHSVSHTSAGLLRNCISSSLCKGIIELNYLLHQVAFLEMHTTCRIWFYTIPINDFSKKGNVKSPEMAYICV